MSQAKRERAGIVIGTASGAVGGGVMGAFVVGVPGIVWAIAAAAVGILLGGYAGAIIGGLFGAEEPVLADADTKETKAA
jgi:hypothetical protein